MFRPICWLLLIFNVSANYLVTNGYSFSTECPLKNADTTNKNVDSRELEKNLGEAHREYRIQFKGITDMQEVIGINEVFTRAEEDCESIL
uniref:Uncharacterized protein n=1 Tax=Caenorhabditis japonica TaxID=281687 RepID=A0A8R1E4F0_CAEJA